MINDHIDTFPELIILFREMLELGFKICFNPDEKSVIFSDGAKSQHISCSTEIYWWLWNQCEQENQQLTSLITYQLTNLNRLLRKDKISTIIND